MMRWLILAMALSGLAALSAYGLRQPDSPTPSIRGGRSVPGVWGDRDVVFEWVRVAEVLPGGAFAAWVGTSRVVFRGAPEVSVGEDLTVRAAYDPASREYVIEAARTLPHGMKVFLGVILGVSIVVMLVVAVNVRHRFRSMGPAGLARREGSSAWRTS